MLSTGGVLSTLDVISIIIVLDMNIKNYLLAHPESKLDELVKVTGKSRDHIRKLRVKLGLPPYKETSQNKKLNPKDEVEKDITVRTLTEKSKNKDQKYNVLLEQNEILSRALEVTKKIKDVQFFKIKSGDIAESEATAVALASDFHSEEKVRLEEVNGLNEYNLDIFSKRADVFFANIVRLIKAKQKSIKVNKLILALLGDFISGNLHEENLATSQLEPMEAIVNVQNKIASGIQYILDNTNIQLIIPCHSGNHARITKKSRHATEAGNSMEYLMYHTLAGVFKDDKRVQFIISPSYHSYIDINGFIIRFHHGHNIKYGGGIGGLTIPALKAIAGWNSIRTADLDCFGHLHQQFYGGNFMCNGSMIGFNAYAVAIKARFERPRQSFFLVNHSRKEVTDYGPVWLN